MSSPDITIITDILGLDDSMDRFIINECTLYSRFYGFKGKAIKLYGIHISYFQYTQTREIKNCELVNFHSCIGVLYGIDYLLRCMKKCQILICIESDITHDILNHLVLLKNVRTLHVEYSPEEMDKSFEIYEGNKNQIAILDRIIFRNLRVPDLSYFKKCSDVHLSNCIVTDQNLSQLKNAKSIILENCRGVTGSFRQGMEFCKIVMN